MKKKKKLNLCKILKDCPKGTKLYSPILGVVKFVQVSSFSDFPIKVETQNGTIKAFTSEGLYYRVYDNAECLLFPSKSNRDWDNCPDNVIFSKEWFDCGYLTKLK